MKNIMLDLETLGTKPGSVILSIGAVEFDAQLGLGREFYSEISVQSCLSHGLTTDQATLDWWEKQSPEARATLDRCLLPEETPKTAAPKLPIVLLDFVRWCDAGGVSAANAKLWGNGSDFDNVLLASAFLAAKDTYPFKFWNHRCFRSLKSLPMVNGKALEPLRAGVHHNALDDAKHQAQWAITILRKLQAGQDAEAERIAGALSRSPVITKEPSRKLPHPQEIGFGEPPPKPQQATEPRQRGAWPFPRSATPSNDT